MKNTFLVLLAMVLAVPLVPFVLFGEIDGMHWVEGTTGVVTFIYGALLLAGDILLPLPSSLIAVFLGAQLGWFTGAMSVFIGLMMGSVIGYALGWYVGRKMMDRLASQRSQEVYARLEHQLSYWALAVCRSVPMLAEASVLAAGVARLDIRKTIPMLLISNLGLALLYSAFGSLGAKQSSPMFLFAGGILVPLAGVLILVLFFGKSLFRRPTPDQVC